GILSGEQAEQVIEEILTPLNSDSDMDTLILGCTHYPLLKGTIQMTLGEQITLISSSEGTARETRTVLDVHHLLNQGSKMPEHQFYATGDLAILTKLSKATCENSDLRSLTLEKAIIN